MAKKTDTTTSNKKLAWPAFEIKSTSHPNLRMAIDPESRKWALFDGNKMVGRRKSIVSLAEAAAEYVTNGPAKKPAKKEAGQATKQSDN